MLTPLTAADREHFAALHLFRRVGMETVEGHIERCAVRLARKGEVLLAPGQLNDSLFLLLTGRLTVHLDSVDQPAVAVLDAGECVGEMSIISETQVSAYVRADEDCRLLQVKQDVLWALVNVSHGVARNLLHILARRLGTDNDVIREKLRIQRQLELYANVDGLTSLHNRRWMNETFPRQIERSRQEGQPVALVLVDVDHFKSFNDRYGHLAGDQALCTLARLIGEHVRPSDLAARYGGEEFAVLLPAADAAVAWGIAERLRRALRETPVSLVDGRRLPSITASFGVAECRGDDTVHSLVAAADEALYRAKRAGRDCVCL